MVNQTHRPFPEERSVEELPSGYNVGFSGTDIPYRKESLAAFSRTRCLPKGYRISELRKIVNDLHRKSRTADPATRTLERQVEEMIRAINQEPDKD